MLGRFLEFSVHTPDVLAAVQCFERLGLRQLSVGETWSHAYAVLSDGRLVLGLHAYRFESPAVTCVQPSLAGHLQLLEELGITFAFAKTGADEFNEAGFVSPAGQMVTLLEARTYSPAPFTDRDFSLLGRFEELMIPAQDPAAEQRFWARLGFEARPAREAPHGCVSLSNGDVTVGVFPASAAGGAPAAGPGLADGSASADGPGFSAGSASAAGPGFAAGPASAAGPGASPSVGASGIGGRALRFRCPFPGSLAMALDRAEIGWRTVTPGPTGGEAAIVFELPPGLRLVAETVAEAA